MTQQSTEYDPKRNHFFIQVDETKYTRKELNHIVRSYYKAVEALKFYADQDCYEKFGRYCLSEIDEDGGEWARKVLEDIEK